MKIAFFSIYIRTRIRQLLGWSTAMNTAFEELKKRISTPPVTLAFPNDDDQLVLSIDASGNGMGGVLRQQTTSGMNVIKYVHLEEIQQCSAKIFNN